MGKPTTLTNQHTLEKQLESIRKLESQMTFRFSQMAKLLENQASELLAGSGLNLMNYRILVIVNVFGSITISDISRVSVMDRSYVSRTVTELNKNGLVDYRAVRGNLRKKAIVLTDDGRALLKSVQPRMAARHGRLADYLGEDGQKEFWSVINKMFAWLEVEAETG